MAGVRNTQLDGWRAFAVLGVMWHHWVPRDWRGPIPFELGLFYFLTLTGFLITGILLRERGIGESSGRSWRGKAYFLFQKRRISRILIPCYAAMLFAIAVGCRDIRENWPIYFGHMSNFHMAFRERWPEGTAHFWTLAIQMQFYVLWPLVIFLTPRRALVWVLALLVTLAPLTRFLLASFYPGVPHGEAITTSALDYLGIGALLAVALERGMAEGDVRLKRMAWVAFAGYSALYVRENTGMPVAGFRYLQQTLLSIAFAGLISGTLAGFHGFRGRVLNHPAIQRIGKLSFGLYLFHTPVPMFLGFVAPWLWHPGPDGPMMALRVLAFGLTSWGLAHLCLRFLENGMPAVRRPEPRVVSGFPDR